MLALGHGFPALSSLYVDSVMRHRKPGQQHPDDVLSLVAKDFELVRKEAVALGDRLKSCVDFATWRKQIADHPPSAEAIAYLVVIHETEAVTMEIKRRKTALSKAGATGGAARASKLTPLKNWAVEEGQKVKGNPSEKARLLMKRITPALASLSNDPERVMREAIKASEKST